MLFYEVKLVNPETKEIYFHKTGERPELPGKDILDKYRGAMIIINTTTFLIYDTKNLEK